MNLIKYRKKKCAAVLTGLLLLALALLLPAEGVKASQNQTNPVTTDGKGSIATEDFDIHISFGIDGNTRSGALIPVTIEMESLQADFEGLVRIIMPAGSSSGSYESVAYEQELVLTAGSPKKLHMNVKNAGNSYYCFFQLEDADGRLLLDRQLSLATAYSEKALVGILSDDYTALTYFDRLAISTDEYEGTSQIVELSADDMPAHESGLDALSYLVINSFDTSSLSTDQQQVLLDWIRNGGVLLLGGGSDYRQTLAMFAPEVLTTEVSGFGEGTITATTSAGKEISLSYDSSAGILQLGLKDGEVLSGVTKESGLVWEKDYGEGRIVMTAFNLGMNPVADWSGNADLARTLLNESAHDYPSQRMYAVNYGEESGGFYSNSIGQLFSDKELNLSMIMSLLLLFVVLLPVSYLVLKRMDHREYLWLLIPLEAAAFTLILFVATMDVRIRQPLEASTTIICDNKGTQTQSVSMDLLAPQTKWYTYNFDSSLTNLQQSEYNEVWIYSSSQTQIPDEADKEYQMALKETAEGLQLRAVSDATFSETHLEFDRKTEDSQDACEMEIRVTMNYNGVYGSITNTSGHDLADVLLVCGNSRVCLGDIDAGASVSFTEDDNEMVYDDEAVTPNEREDSAEYRAILACYNNVYVLIHDESKWNADCYLVAYIRDWNADYIREEAIEETNVAALVKSVRVNFEGYDESAWAIKVFDYADNADGEGWDTYDGMLYQKSVETEISLPETMEHVYALTRASDADAAFGPTTSTHIYLWNYDRGAYEEIFKDELHMAFEENTPYVQDHKMKMKFTCAHADGEDYVPQMTLIGGSN